MRERATVSSFEQIGLLTPMEKAVASSFAFHSAALLAV